jgi:hypothetical protein
MILESMHVTLRLYTLPEYPNDPLQGNAAIVYLTVYDPPFISCTDNDTVVYSPEGEQTAVLECAVDNREDWLNVSVNWTTTGDKEITAPHTVAEANNVSYLLLHKISNWKNNSHFYTCNVYSNFGLEDQRILQVILLEPACSNCTCPDKPTTTTDPDDPDCNGKDLHYKFLLIPIAILVVCLFVWIILTVLFGKSISEKSFKFFHLIKIHISRLRQ